jgi:hypothetical protein
MPGDNKRIHVGASIFLLLMIASLASRCDRNPSPIPMTHTVEHHLQSNQVDAGGIVVEIRPAESISKEHHSDDGRVTVTAGTTEVVIENGEVTVNSVAFGTVAPGDVVLVDGDVVYVNDELRNAEGEGRG